MTNAHFGPKPARRAADLALLLLASSLLFIGVLAMSGQPPRWWWIGYPLVLQLVLFVWVATMPENKSRVHDALRVSNSLQINVLARIIVNTLVTVVALVVLYQLFELVQGPPKLFRLMTRLGELLPLALLGVPLGGIFFTVWYVHALRSRGLVLAELNGSAYRTLEAGIAGMLPTVTARLEHHLHTLVSENGPGMPWTMYGKHPKVTRTHMDKHFVQFDCVWTWCPTKVVLSVRDNGAGSTTLRAHCELRKGLYRLDCVLNVCEVVMQLAFIKSNLVQLLQSEFALTEARQHHEGLRRQALEMQLRVLQAQIEPHFFFNTLANLRHLYRTDIDAGEDMLNHLISYLRGAMDNLRSDESSVAAEFELASHFLAIMKVRMGERLSYAFINHDDVGAHAFPPAMLISLVENAIKHGLREKADGHLRITAARLADTIRISVLDNGAGFSSVDGTGVGLSNIRQRLEAIYGERAWLEVGAPAEGGFIATIVIPA